MKKLDWNKRFFSWQDKKNVSTIGAQFVNPHQSQILLIKVFLDSHVDHSVLYMKFICQKCLETGKTSKYIGETGRPLM